MMAKTMCIGDKGMDKQLKGTETDLKINQLKDQKRMSKQQRGLEALLLK